MTFKDLQDAALEECGYSTSGASTPRTRMKRRINEHQRRILARPGFARLLRDNTQYTFASSTSVSAYGMPWALGRVNKIFEGTNDRFLEMYSLDWLREHDPGLTASGTPVAWIPLGWAPVAKQPSDASKLVVDSSSASDTGTAFVEYLNAAGERLTASVTMTGTTAVEVVTTAVAMEVTKFYLSAAAVGRVTLHEDASGGTELGAIPIGATYGRYLRVQLWPTPTSAITYTVDYTREMADMVNDMDEPFLPPDFQPVLYLGAVADEWRMKDDTRYAQVRADLEDYLARMNSWVWNQADYLPRPESVGPRTSRLGGWFEAGT